MTRKDKGYGKIVLLLLLIAVAVYVGNRFFMLSLVPGPEGVRALNYGVQTNAYSPIYVASMMENLPKGYTWVSNQPSSLVVKHLKDPGEPLGGFFVNGPGWWYDHDQGAVRSEVQRPALILGDPIHISKREIVYYKYVQKSPTEIEIHKMVCQIVPADFIIQISSVPGEGVYTWRNFRIWYALDTVTWLNAYAKEPPQDPNPLTNETVKFISANYRGAFPIIAWIEEYKDWVWKDEQGKTTSNPPDQNAISFCQLDPSLEGRFIDLYTSPGSTYQLYLSSDVLSNSDLLAEALKPNNLPDPRFAETVYFYITLTKFGPYVKPTGVLGSYSSFEVWYPSVFYRLRVEYAVYGEYVYLWTKETAEEAGYQYGGEEEGKGEWEVRETEEETYTDPLTSLINSVMNFLANPFALLGLGLFSLLAIGLVVAIVLFWLVGAPRKR